MRQRATEYHGMTSASEDASQVAVPEFHVHVEVAVKVRVARSQVALTGLANSDMRRIQTVEPS
jgi:hypothetical protein